MSNKVIHSYMLTGVSLKFVHRDSGPLVFRNSFDFVSRGVSFSSFCRSFSLDYDSVPLMFDTLYMSAYKAPNYGIRYVLRLSMGAPVFEFVLNPKFAKCFEDFLSSLDCEIPF